MNASDCYETERAVSEYLLFHYGTPEQVLPWPFGPSAALDYPVRCVTACLQIGGLPPQPRALVFPAQGKPGWPAGPDFSISHSAARAGCALAPKDNRVGLDIEQRGTAAGTGLRRVASDREQSLYESSGLTLDDLWTAKEAVLKAAGAGATQAGEVILEVDSALLRGVRYVLMRPFVATDCSCTLAATRPAGLTAREVDSAWLLDAVG